MYSLRFRGRNWYARFRDGHGRRVEKKLPFGKDQKKLAQGYANDLATQAQRVRDGLERATEKLTLDDLWRRFSPGARHKRSWASIRGRWERHIQPELGHKQLHAIEPADVEALTARLMADGYSPQTAEHVRVLLSSMYTFALRKLRVLKGENPARIAERPKIPPPRIRFLDHESLRRLLAAVPEQWAGIFAVSAYTGLRKGEVLGLKLGDVDLGRNLLWVWRSYDRSTTKGNKGRVVAFPPALAAHLRKAMAQAVDLQSTWLFPRLEEGSSKRKGGAAKKGEARGSDTKLTNVLREALRTAGIQAPDGFSYKDLRSTYATHLAELTGDLRVVQKQLGHSSPALTDKHYAFVRDRLLVDQVARLPYGNPAHPEPPKPAEPDQTQPTTAEVN
jgi:integrase